MQPASGLWTKQRFELRRALGRVDEALGELYERGIHALNDQPMTLSGVVVAAHCFREIANTLPDVLEDVDEVPAYSDISAPAQNLQKEWAKNSDLVESPVAPMLPTSTSDTEPTPVVSVPLDLLEAARAVVVASENGSTNARLRASAVVLGRLEAQRDTSVELFRDSVRFFVRRAHLNRARQLRHDEDDVMDNLRVIEVALLARVGHFFETVEDLMDVISLANRRIGEEPL